MSYAWNIGLRTKDAALHVTRQWLTYIENQFGAKVQKWKSDSGGELKSTAFTNMLKDRGIEIITSAPHIHQQNGRAERIIRTLMDKGEAMRFDACIPQSWWEFSFEHAAHVYNRTPMKRLDWRTPYEILHGSKPDISHLRVFGCGAYVFLPPEVRKNKLSPKSELMVYLGVGPGGHNHKFMRLPNNVIFTAAQALFDEHLFPKCPGHDTKRQRQPMAPEGSKKEKPANQVPAPSLLPDDDEEPRHPAPKPSKKDKGKGRDVAPPAPPAKPPVPPPQRVQSPERVQRPPSPPSPPVRTRAPSPRRSGRERKVPTREGNVYGESRHPTDIFKDVEKETSWRNMVKTRSQPSRSRPASGPVSRNESPVPGPSSSNVHPRSVPQSRDPSRPPSKWNTPRESTPVLSSGSSDAEKQNAPESNPDPEPAEASDHSRSGAPDDSGPAPPSSDEESDEEDDDDDDDDDDNTSDDDDDADDDDDDDDDDEDSSEEVEVENALRDPARVDAAELCRKGGVHKELTAKTIRKLISKAIPPLEGEKVPPQNVREWTFRDIVSLPKAEQKEWFTACREELEALRARDVYDLVDRPKGRKVVKNRWVFDVKTDGRKKARLVAKGFSQVEGEDFDKIFSPVVRFETVRLILALAALEDWHISGLDVRSAYLYGKLDEEIYMEQPEGFRKPGTEHKVFKLKRALYGLKQAGLAWWRTLSESMTLMGFKRLSNDAGIYVYKRHSDGKLVVVIVYVDDALFCGKDKKLVAKLKARFMQKWECRDLGDVKEFLRMRIVRKGSNIHLDQCAYLEKVLERCGMTNARPAPTPLPAGYIPAPNKGQAKPELRSRFQTVIGSLLYLMLGTRPDLAFAVTKLAQFASNPSDEHLDRALYICRYLVGTKDYSLVYNGGSQAGFIAGTDSDWASDPHSRRSQTGFFLKLANGIFSWQSRAQKTIAHSSTEAEYMAMSDCSRQVVWVRNLLAELGYHVHHIPLSGDNQGSIFIASNPVTEPRSKHIDIRYHYIREVHEKGIVDVFYIDGNDNPADIFTKNLGVVKFLKFRSQLGLHFPRA